MIIAAIPVAVTTPAALAALIGGVALAFVGPWGVGRMAHANPATPVAPTTRWAVIFIVEVVAAALLFTAGHAFSVIPQLATALKVVVVLMIASMLAGTTAVLQRS